MAKKDYDAESITILEGLEAVRKRPGMYIGSTGPRGLHHLVYEVVDNSVDEHLAGFASKVFVSINQDGSVSVLDNGRGIPVEEKSGTGKSALEIILTTLHAGGKFDNDSYAVSGGLHGVGISVVNALSKQLAVEVHRDGFVWTQNYSMGDPEGPIKKGNKSEVTGTLVTFWPNDEIFETVEFEYEILRNRLQQTAFLNKGLEITFVDKRVKNTEDNLDEDLSKPVTFKYDQGLVDYVNFLNQGRKAHPINETIVSLEKEDKTQKFSFELAMQWTTSYSETIHTFANTISTNEGGTHDEGFRTALTSLINKYARAKGLLKEKDENLSGEDVREGLTAILSVKLAEPQFEGQTKTKLGNTAMRSFVQKNINEQFGEWLDMHPNEAKAICQKGVDAQIARLAAKKARENSRKKTSEGVSMPHKLKDCKSKDPRICELFIVEGDSAGGSAIDGRDPEIQAILPLRGKILNVEKANVNRILDSETIQNLINAIGSGTGENFKPEKVRYHKIILMSDADVDGAHISTLLLTFIFRHMPNLINLGYVFLAQPPLYKINWQKADSQLAFTEQQKDEIIETGTKEGKILDKEGPLQRYKGLGEMNADQLWETTMNPGERILKQITLEDAAISDETVSILMGDDVEPRREFIQRNAQDVRFLDI